MNRRVRWMAFLLVASLLATMLAACGAAPAGGGETVASEAAATTEAAPSTAAEPSAAAEPSTQAASTESEPSTAAAESAAPAAAGNVKDLTIIWAQWDPANYLQQLVQQYEAESGVAVKVVQEPWGSFYNRAFAEFAAKGTAYDMVVGDSQWLGQGATQGHYVELTDVFNSELNGEALAPATVAAYAEYPKGSGSYWAYPTEGDADGWAYRKDLFENADEQAAFKEKYGYDLAVPKTWSELRDIAEFFTRPDQNLYGLSIYTQKDYDAITMGFQNVMFSYGADWGDPESYKVEGILNSAENAEALELYRELYKFVPPGSSNDFFQESNNHFTSGQVAMAMNYFAFFPALANSATNPYADNTGFFANPAGPDGARHAALGGQGISVVSYIDDERKQAAMDFLKWFGQNDTQLEWAALGGYTCNEEVLNSPEFLENTPYNQAFADSMKMVKDFWAVPVYGELLEVSQRELHNFVVVGEGTAQETLDKITQQHEAIFKEAGLLK